VRAVAEMVKAEARAKDARIMTMNPSGWMILQESFRICKEKRSCNGERKNIGNLFGCETIVYLYLCCKIFANLS
jgi:hypothetical protein